MSLLLSPPLVKRSARQLLVVGLGLLVGMVPFWPMLAMAALLAALPHQSVGSPLATGRADLFFAQFLLFMLAPLFLVVAFVLSFLGCLTLRWRLLGVGVFMMWGLMGLLLVLGVNPVPAVPLPE